MISIRSGLAMQNRRFRFNQSQELRRSIKTLAPSSTRTGLCFWLVLLVTVPALIEAKESWGWAVHEYINYHAVEHLPSEMSFVLDHQVFLRQHAIDPDADGSPGYYHYIDIDYYQEFYNGTLPHEWDEILTLYDESIVRDVGIIPWVIQWWTDSLSALMSRNQWDNAWQIAANLGHYVADSHQPLHLTLNYNGQFSGNDGIHSRYESQLITPHLGILPLPEGEAVYWDSVIDSVFGYIGESYANINWILLADNLASSQDASYGSTYYSVMWTELETLTIGSVHSAILDLASIWYTAWVNAGKPVPSLDTEGSLHEKLTPTRYSMYQNYPNPFNPTTTIRFRTPVSATVGIRIFDMKGHEVNTLLNSILPAGDHTIVWNGQDYQQRLVPAGLYLCELQASTFNSVIKMLLLN